MAVREDGNYFTKPRGEREVICFRYKDYEIVTDYNSDHEAYESEIAKTDQANFRSADQAGAVIAVAAPGFAALAEGARRGADAAGEIECHGEAQFGDRLGEDGAGRHHVNAALEQRRIGHVVDEVALDIEDAAQRLQPLQRVRFDRRLADDVAGRRQDRIGQGGQTIGFAFHDLIGVEELPAPRIGQDQRERARMWDTDHQRPVVDSHGWGSRSAHATFSMFDCECGGLADPRITSRDASRLSDGRRLGSAKSSCIMSAAASIIAATG